MTKSSRRKDKVEGRPLWVASDKKCEECQGALVKTGVSSYVCTECGLMQTRVKARRRIRKKKKRKMTNSK